jgi:hypothetical protein
MDNICASFLHAPDNSVIVEVMKADTALSDIPAIWAAKSGKDLDNVYFLCEDGEMPAEGTLKDILPPGAFYVGIRVETSVEMRVSLIGFPNISWRVFVLGNTSAGDILTEARSRLRIAPHNATRLIVEGEPVSPAQKIRDVTNERVILAEIDVQLLFHLCIMRPMQFHPPGYENGHPIADRKQRNIQLMEKETDDRPLVGQCFLSDPAAVLMVEDERFDHQRLLSADMNRTAVCEMAVAEALCEEDLRADSVPLLIELSMPLTINYIKYDYSLKTRVWPSDTIGQIWTDEEEHLAWNGTRFWNSGASFREIGICDDAIVEVTQVISITVRLSNSVQYLNVDPDLPFSEFVVRLRTMEPQPNFHVRIGETRILSSSCTLRELGVRNRSQIDVDWPTATLHVYFEKNGTTFHDVDEKWRYRDLLLKSEEAFGRSFPDYHFICLCGRIVSADEFHREVPLGCCEKQVFRLRPPVLSKHVLTVFEKIELG